MWFRSVQRKALQYKGRGCNNTFQLSSGVQKMYTQNTKDKKMYTQNTKDKKMYTKNTKIQKYTQKSIAV